jgi:hypothetical protein
LMWNLVEDYAIKISDHRLIEMWMFVTDTKVLFTASWNLKSMLTEHWKLFVLGIWSWIL